MNIPFIVKLPKDGLDAEKVLLKVKECVEMGEKINNECISF